MPGLVCFICFIGAHLASPCICTDRSDVSFTDPMGGLKGQSRGIATGIARPIAFCQTAFLVTGAYNDKITLTNFDTLGRGTGRKIIIGNGISIFQ